MLTGPVPTVSPGATPREVPCAASLTFDEAFALMMSQVDPLEIREVPLVEAFGHFLADAVVANVDAPRRDVAAMDGYAVFGDGMQFEVVGTSFPDSPTPPPLKRHEALRVFTGAPVPSGADRVVVQESTSGDGRTVQILSPSRCGSHIRRAGSDFPAGSVLIEPGRAVCARTIAVAAAADRDTIRIWRRPRVAVLTTGDELAPAGTARLTANAVPDSLGPALSVAIAAWSGVLVSASRIADDQRSMSLAAKQAVGSADVVVVVGGASKGTKDLARASLAAHGLVPLFAGVDMKPGKPVWYGAVNGRHVLGVPGNPTAAMTVARLFLAPLLQRLGGHAFPKLPWRTATLVDTAPASDREQFLCGKRTPQGVALISHQRASAQATLADADVLVRIRPGKANPAGSIVEYIDQ
ncbi:molybdopterin molybdotransferase MoeA [Sphingomonas sp.]|uniref:molybdopterin molybdotransferase MoeA n=1 Tax=Sphingomonas sp. TaxID=28214 RepID=UPI0031D82A27